jgi:mannose/fructose-specific phosphotransferase system component IIA
MSEERSSLRGVLLAHGAMAEGMADAIRKIAGVGEETLVAISNDGKTPDSLKDELDGLLGESPSIIFTDLASGSCALTARVCCRAGFEQAVIFGANLPLLLDFVFNRQLPLDELVPRLLAKGKASIQSTPEYPDHADRPLQS